MRYATPEAFRAALDQRLKNHAAQTGIPLMRLRKTIAFDRFLARLVAVASDRWVLKGAMALDLRIASGTRTTKDVDLGRFDDEDAATDDFLAAQALDLGDFFTFVVQRTPTLDAAADFSTVRTALTQNSPDAASKSSPSTSPSPIHSPGSPTVSAVPTSSTSPASSSPASRWSSTWPRSSTPTPAPTARTPARALAPKTSSTSSWSST